MKVLLVSLFHPNLVRGGAQQVCYELFEALRESPDFHPVLLSAIEPRFEALYKSGARITGFDNRPDEYLFLTQEYDHWYHRNMNQLLAEAYVEFLLEVKPDVVHFHHFMLFGVNLISLTRRVLPHARLVFTFHEFMAICAANGHMLRKIDNSLCSAASNVRCQQCFPERTPEDFFMREMWMKKHLAVIDVFTTPSRFMIEHYTTWGIDPRILFHVTNGQRNYAKGQIRHDVRKQRNRFGFFGQFVDNKGVWLILEAVERLRSSGFTDFTIELNGDNLIYASPERRAEIEAFMEAEQALPMAERNVVMNASYEVSQLASRMGRIDWCLVPSTWWESFGLVISEAGMFRRPLIASDVGGPRERIRHEVDGLLFEVGDSRALAEAIQRAATEEGLWERLEANIQEPPARQLMLDGFAALYRSNNS